MESLSELLTLFATLAGFGALVALVVNVGKAVRLVPNGTAPTVATGLNLVVLVALYFARVFRPDLDVAALDGLARQVAEIGVLVLGFVVQLKSSKLTHETVKGAALVGYSHSESAG